MGSVSYALLSLAAPPALPFDGRYGAERFRRGKVTATHACVGKALDAMLSRPPCPHAVAFRAPRA